MAPRVSHQLIRQVMRITNACKAKVSAKGWTHKTRQRCMVYFGIEPTRFAVPPGGRFVKPVHKFNETVTVRWLDKKQWNFSHNDLAILISRLTAPYRYNDSTEDRPKTLHEWLGSIDDKDTLDLEDLLEIGVLMYFGEQMDEEDLKQIDDALERISNKMEADPALVSTNPRVITGYQKDMQRLWYIRDLWEYVYRKANVPLPRVPWEQQGSGIAENQDENRRSRSSSGDLSRAASKKRKASPRSRNPSKKLKKLEDVNDQEDDSDDDDGTVGEGVTRTGRQGRKAYANSSTGNAAVSSADGGGAAGEVSAATTTTAESSTATATVTEGHTDQEDDSDNDCGTAGEGITAVTTVDGGATAAANSDCVMM